MHWIFFCPTIYFSEMTEVGILFRINLLWQLIKSQYNLPFFCLFVFEEEVLYRISGNFHYIGTLLLPFFIYIQLFTLLTKAFPVNRSQGFFPICP